MLLPADAFTSPPVPSDVWDPTDLRVGQLLGRAVRSAEEATVVLVGFPSDTGVRRNGGRPGARQAPQAIREAFYRLTPDPRAGQAFIALLERTFDLGDFRMKRTLEASQEHFGRLIAPLLRAGKLVIILGGGHETAYAHFLAYVHAAQPVHILNWDAHADVRPLRDGKAHSGSPFRQALTHPSGCCQSYTVAGLLPHSTAPDHLRFLHQHQAHYFWRDALTEDRIADLYSPERTPLMVSFDLDLVDQAFAPGVSAPATDGLSPERWLQAAYEAGRCPAVQSMDLVECNPRLDRDRQTIRLAALTLWTYFCGLAERLR
ncbi:formimidoylglutamase [Rhodothermus profundi]|uniref:Formiminoglutamase n=1 Tax=Rhodothermus profundi TaxID=633813 RepID=A0A1M6WV21_9BACT|nr:formimidoylglutamase [Rhodothermus profundi]SHK97395.1 formiminoglutamase [Rhodothermus profundi]